MKGVARQIRSLVAAKFGILLIAIEGLFEIRIPDEDFAELQTLDEVTGYVATRL
jgi:acyl carrier protein